MSDLPILWPDKVNSPYLQALLQQYGEESYLDANGINQIKRALNFLYNSVGGGTGVVNNTGFTLGNQVCIFNALFAWKFNGTNYVLPEELEIGIPYTDDGFHRIDLIVSEGEDLIRVQGPVVPVSNSPAEPVYNSSTQLRITAILVNSDGFGEVEPIADLEQYLKKIYSNPYTFSGTGANAEIPFNADGKAEVRLTNSTLVSISGFTNENLNVNDEQPYLGKPISIRNLTGVPVTLLHESQDALFPLYLNSGSNLILPPNEVIDFKFNNAGLSEHIKSWSNSNASEGYNPNSYLIPELYAHNWTQAGEPSFNLVHPNNAGNVRIRMEAPGLGSTYYIKFYFKVPVLISEIYYCNGSAIITDGSIEQFKLFGSTSVKSDNSFPLTLHDSTVGDAVMQVSNGTTDFFEPKKITLANPLTVASLRFEAHTIYPGGSTRPRIQKILFK